MARDGIGELPEDFRELLDRPESETLEFKTDLREPHAAAHLVSAFANSGGGQIVRAIVATRSGAFS